MKHRATRVHIRRPHQQRMQAGLDGGCAIAQCRSEWRQEGGREVCLRGRPVSESLEDDLLRLGVAELGQVGQACELDHRRRATHEYEALLLWAGQPLRDHGVGDETGGELPAGGRSVERVPHLEARGVLGRIPVVGVRVGVRVGSRVGVAVEVWVRVGGGRTRRASRALYSLWCSYSLCTRRASRARGYRPRSGWRTAPRPRSCRWGRPG
eukprot:scaffold24493_cov61-Phaeocystis_antarctica.AAC.3